MQQLLFIETQLVDFLIGLNEKVSNYIGTVSMRTLHTRGKEYKFRASPHCLFRRRRSLLLTPGRLVLLLATSSTSKRHCMCNFVFAVKI